MPKLLSRKFAKDLPEILVSTYFEKKKRYHRDGLFSEHIFGLENNYTCRCGIYHGKHAEGSVCNGKFCDGLEITNSLKRRRQYAKITLPIPLLNRTYLSLVKKIIPDTEKELFSDIDKLMKSHRNILYYVDNELVLRSMNEDEQFSDLKIDYWQMHEAVEKLIKYIIAEYMIVDPTNKDYKMLLDKLEEHLFLYEVIVIPPAMRPISQINPTTNSVDQLNQYYYQLLVKKEIMAAGDIDVTRHMQIYQQYYAQFQYTVDELHKYIIENISKKEGLIRGNILGKRIDFSGRAVIAPSPTISLDECILPYRMVLELYKIPIAKKLIQNGQFKLIHHALECVEACQFHNDPQLLSFCRDVIGDDVCLLNRQPSLHKLSLVAFKIKVSLVDVIYIHPMVCQGFNADFDGDAMAVYLPVTPEAQKEAKQQALSTKCLLNPTDMKITTTPSQEMVLGLYLLSISTDNEYGKKVIFKDTEMTVGMKIINECFPDSFPVINEKITSNVIRQYIYDAFNKYNGDIKDILDNIKTVGFKYATAIGHTISLKGMYSQTKLRDEIYAMPKITDQIKEISGDRVMKFLRKNFQYADMIESGARGSWDQARQLILSRGFISNFKGNILATPIKNSFVDGLTPEEFFNSSFGCRKGLLDVAVKTSFSGYLFRKFAFACSNLMIDHENEDCGTTDYMAIYIPDLKTSQSLIGRWITFDRNIHDLILVKPSNLKKFVNKKIYVRSPIYCQTEKLCKKCYGELYKHLNNSRFVGSIAAQALGESNTQMVLRTFHTSGVASIDDNAINESDEMEQNDIVSALTLISKLVHKYEKDRNADDLVNDLYSIYSKDRFFMHVHFECLVAQLMWFDDKDKWRTVEDRKNKPYQMKSIVSIPSLESWIMGISFSNTKRELINGLLRPGIYSGGVIDKIMCGISYKNI
jgi:DNA-directed RNA polymerase subunit beta'